MSAFWWSKTAKCQFRPLGDVWDWKWRDATFQFLDPNFDIGRRAVENFRQSLIVLKLFDLFVLAGLWHRGPKVYEYLKDNYLNTFSQQTRPRKVLPDNRPRRVSRQAWWAVKGSDMSFWKINSNLEMYRNRLFHVYAERFVADGFQPNLANYEKLPVQLTMQNFFDHGKGLNSTGLKIACSLNSLGSALFRTTSLV